jgi:hypothetical protein
MSIRDKYILKMLVHNLKPLYSKTYIQSSRTSRIIMNTLNQSIRGELISYKNGKVFNLVFECKLMYSLTAKADVYFFDIWDESEQNKRKFSFQLRVMENQKDLKVIDLFAFDYVGRGISIEIILKCKELFKKRIISSSNNKKSFPEEAIWPDAIDKVWNRMVKLGLAKFDHANDYFYIL